MLVELRVRDLGVIADLGLVLGPGMTALTGETGAGKTLVVEAIELLMGGRADPVLVRPGAEEAWAEGRFVTDGAEVVIARAVPNGGGRSRGYVDGRMAPVAALSELGDGLVDLHGQHAHQSLLRPATQRAALDAFGGIDLGPLQGARAALAGTERRLAELGGDSRSRARELDLLRFQVDEIEAAGLDDPHEDERLATEEDRLADAGAHREAAATAHEALAADGGAADALGAALATLGSRQPLAFLAERIRALQAEVTDVASELRAVAESMEDDPERLAEVHARRELLRELRRKYGEDLAAVMAYGAEAARRRDELDSHDTLVAELEAAREGEAKAVAAAEQAVAAARRKVAPKLAKAVEAQLRSLAMPRARIAIEVEGDGPADEVSILLAANPGEPALPLVKVASGGELARTMLAAQLVLSAGPPTLIFDEVDAGIGGETAIAVGRALAELARRHQVIVVTHLAQVAAFADHQVAVTKREQGRRTIAEATLLDDGTRVRELARMLSGQPESSTAVRHAEELLEQARAERRTRAAS